MMMKKREEKRISKSLRIQEKRQMNRVNITNRNDYDIVDIDNE
jgi:hypothetical protein